MGLEFIDQVRNLDAVVLPVGGGGLLAGVALAVKTVYPDIKIIVRMTNKKMNNQFNVLTRFLKPHLYYCSVVCQTNIEIYPKLIINDFNSSYSHLLDTINSISLYDRRIQCILILLHKSLF